MCWYDPLYFFTFTFLHYRSHYSHHRYFLFQCQSNGYSTNLPHSLNSLLIQNLFYQNYVVVAGQSFIQICELFAFAFIPIPFYQNNIVLQQNFLRINKCYTRCPNEVGTISNFYIIIATKLVKLKHQFFEVYTKIPFFY